MGGYIRMDKDLEDDPRVGDLGESLARSHLGLVGEPPYDSKQLAVLGLACDAVIGGLYRLWRYGDTYLGRHDRLKGASRGFARISEVTALPASLLSQFPTEWLQIHPDGTVELPGYSAKNALINRDQRRDGGRERTARWRERKRLKDQAGDASPAVTTEASQRHKSVTTGTGTGTGTGTVPTVPGSGDRTEKKPRETVTPSRPLASALGHLAAGSEQPRAPEPKPPPTKSAQELETDARKLAASGLQSGDIAKCLSGYGVTTDQVARWLANPGSVTA